MYLFLRSVFKYVDFGSRFNCISQFNKMLVQNMFNYPFANNKIVILSNQCLVASKFNYFK